MMTCSFQFAISRLSLPLALPLLVTDAFPTELHEPRPGPSFPDWNDQSFNKFSSHCGDLSMHGGQEWEQAARDLKPKRANLHHRCAFVQRTTAEARKFMEFGRLASVDRRQQHQINRAEPGSRIRWQRESGSVRSSTTACATRASWCPQACPCFLIARRTIFLQSQMSMIVFAALSPLVHHQTYQHHLILFTHLFLCGFVCLSCIQGNVFPTIVLHVSLRVLRSFFR